MFKFLAKDPFIGLQKQASGLYDSLPDLPSSWVNFLVKIAPVLAIIGGVFSLLGALPMFGLGTMALPFLMVGKSTALYIMGVLSIITGVMLLSAVKPLKDRRKIAISILFWSSVLNTIGSLMINLALGPILGLVIGFYFLFQVQPRYQ